MPIQLKIIATCKQRDILMHLKHSLVHLKDQCNFIIIWVKLVVKKVTKQVKLGKPKDLPQFYVPVNCVWFVKSVLFRGKSNIF